MDVTFTVGHKEYTLQAQDGEERLLRRAGALLDDEAQKIIEQAGRMPEPRLLLLAGLMLADRHNSMEDRALVARRPEGPDAHPVEYPGKPHRCAPGLAGGV